MQFSVIYGVPVPDLSTAGRLYGLDDLDDRSVAKVIYHRRRQATGSEALRWEQCMIGGLNLVSLRAEGVEIETRVTGQDTEAGTLGLIAPLAERGEPIVTWDAERSLLPLLRFRAVALGHPLPVLWDSTSRRDLCDALVTATEDRPSLDEIAQRLGLPGMAECVETAAVDQWLAGDVEALRACIESGGFSLFLLALRIFHAAGELSSDDVNRARHQLEHRLSEQTNGSSQAFLRRWRGAR